eukprot:g21783.t1
MLMGQSARITAINDGRDDKSMAMKTLKVGKIAANDGYDGNGIGIVVKKRKLTDTDCSLEVPGHLVRDFIGWSEMLPIVFVCKSLSTLFKTPQFWQGLHELDLSKFRHGGPLVAMPHVWRESNLVFPKLRLSGGIVDDALFRLRGLAVKYLNLDRCEKIPELTLAWLTWPRCPSSISILDSAPVSQTLHLKLSFCKKITDAGLAHLAALPLHHLDIDRCKKITDVGLAHLTALPLQYLGLAECTRITDAGLAHLAALPLQRLNLAFCNITSAGLAYLTALSLQHLSFTCCDNVTDAGLAHLAALPLQYLCIDSCIKITDAGLAHLAALPLQHLNFVCCEEITDAGLAHLAVLPLTWLDCSWCSITDAGLAHLAALPLQYLRCCCISEAGLVHLTALPLRKLAVDRSCEIPSAAFGHFSTKVEIWRCESDYCDCDDEWVEADEDEEDDEDENAEEED